MLTLLEGHLSQMHDKGSGLESILLFLQGETKSIESLISKLQLFRVINGVNLDLSLGKAAKRVLGIED